MGGEGILGAAVPGPRAPPRALQAGSVWEEREMEETVEG